MNAPDLHTLTGAFALDALEPGERTAFEEHLQDCSVCREEVAGLTATAGLLAAAAAEPPPAGLRARVLDDAARTRQMSPRVVDLGRRRTSWYRQPAAAAAALMLVVSAGLGAVTVRALDEADRADARTARVTAIATDPSRVEKAVALPSGARAVVLAAHGEAVFRATGLRRLPAGEVYQLWVLRGGAAQSAGVLGDGGDAEALLDEVASATALAVTVEPEGGSEAPTGDVVVSVPIT